MHKSPLLKTSILHHSSVSPTSPLRCSFCSFFSTFFFASPKKGSAKKCSNYHTIALISHTSKEMFNILQARLQQYINRELPDVQAGFQKGRGTRDQVANICWIINKANKFQKNIYFCLIDYATFCDCGSQQTLEN